MPTRFTFTESLNWFLSTTWPQRVVWGVQCAALWVGLELIVGSLFTGFPWLYVGVSQYRMLPVIQLASLTGVHGVSFLAVWFSISLASALLILFWQPAIIFGKPSGGDSQEDVAQTTCRLSSQGRTELTEQQMSASRIVAESRATAHQVHLQVRRLQPNRFRRTAAPKSSNKTIHGSTGHHWLKQV
jgi:apolipoprotein N-acyltransferase